MKQILFGRRYRSGLSIIELIMTLAILSILAGLIIPSAQLMSKRNKEIELRRNLRIIRNAIDDFKKTNDKTAEDSKVNLNVTNVKSGYPETLDVLVDGFDFGSVKKENKKFLRRIPCDPFAADKSVSCKETWGLRSYADKADSSTYGGEDVFDVYSKSGDTAIDGSKYKDW